MSVRRSTASSRSSYLARSSSVRRCFHRAPPLRRRTSPARPKWSKCACVTTSRSSRLTALPAADNAAASAAVPSGPGSPTSTPPQSISVSPSSPCSRYALPVGTPWIPSGSASRYTPSATQRPRRWSSSVRCLRPPAAPRSVPNLRHCAQFVRRGRAVAEELQVGRDLLEEHVLADLYCAALVEGNLQEGRDLLLHHDLAHEGRRGNPVDVHREGVVVVHAQGRGVDDDVVTLGVL